SPLASLLAHLRGLVGDVATITLGALPADGISHLFADDELGSVIAQESDGTPFAVTEVVRTLAARGVIELDPGGRWRVVEEGAASIGREAARAGQRRALRDRAHLQPPGPRDVLSLLALVGRETPARVLAAAAGVDQATVLGDLDALAGAGLVRLGEGGWALRRVPELPEAARAGGRARSASRRLPRPRHDERGPGGAENTSGAPSRNRPA